MPCYDPETHERPMRLESKVHCLTAMLCAICGIIEATHPEIISNNPSLFEWWENHKAHDAYVSALEEKRRVDESSLTPSERGVLWTAHEISY